MDAPLRLDFSFPQQPREGAGLRRAQVQNPQGWDLAPCELSLVPKGPGEKHPRLSWEVRKLQ